MAAKTQVIRGDDPLLFGKGGKVRAAKLFPLLRSYTPGPGVSPTAADQLDQLYDQLAELLAKDDALTPDSPTAAQITEVERALAAIEQQQADALRHAFEAELLSPIGTGQALAADIAAALSESGTSAT